MIIPFEKLEGIFSCALHFRACAVEHVELDLFVSSAAGAFRYLAKESFLASSVEPAIETFCEVGVLNIRELVLGLAKSFPVDAVVVILRFVLVLLQQKDDMILSHYRILDLICVLGCDPFAML